MDVIFKMSAPMGHDRKRKEILDDEDPIERMIGKTGCLEKHYAVQDCMGENQDWRKCQSEVDTFRKCMSDYYKAQSKDSPHKTADNNATT